MWVVAVKVFYFGGKCATPRGKQWGETTQKKATTKWKAKVYCTRTHTTGGRGIQPTPRGEPANRTRKRRCEENGEGPIEGGLAHAFDGAETRPNDSLAYHQTTQFARRVFA